MIQVKYTITFTMAFTQYCNRMYTGCTKTLCTYAHNDLELRSSPAYAKLKSKVFIPPMDTHFFKFIVPNDVVRASVESDDESDSDEAESKDAFVPHSFISLSAITQFEKSPEYQAFRSKWLYEKHSRALSIRMWHLAREYAHATATYGEEDMDCSE
jgi:hypothetical protein